MILAPLTLICISLAVSLPGGQAFVGTGQFFPYGFSQGDSQVPIADDNFVPFNITAGSRFNFFNQSYNSLYVANNGGLSFAQGVSAYTPNCGPLNTPMIVPYWADVDTRFLNGSVFYRESRNATLLQKARAEVQLAFPGLTNLNLTWLFITTWDRVPFFGAGQGNCSNLGITNTFQSILVTDGAMSFAIFNYNQITWTTGTASGGNCLGMGGIPAKAGFDLGDGQTFFSIPGSCTAAIGQVTNTTNVNQPGKWIFRIDQSTITPPPSNATNSTTVAPPTMPTTMPPSTMPPTMRPNNTMGQCDPRTCVHTGHCFSYSFCDRSSQTWQNRQCSEGLFWNPSTGYLKNASTSTGGNSTGSSWNSGNSTNSTSQQGTGSCDVWNNLSWDTKNRYMSDPSCFPTCYFESLGNCSTQYRYHPEDSDARDVKIVSCPLDSRPNGGFRSLVWVQEKESCDFCYNANNWNGSPCCPRYDGGSGNVGNTTGGWNFPPFIPQTGTNGTGNFVPAIGRNTTVG